jgi:peptide deformylase
MESRIHDVGNGKEEPMGIRNIIKVGDEGLRKVSKPIAKFDLRLWLLLKDMADTMYKAEGAGLAAPQVGILRRVVVVDDGNGLVELVNPEIIEKEGEQCGPEGCLSIPGRQGLVCRPNKVTVRAQDRHGKFFERTGEGLLARAFCHEIDHLDGILYIDIMEREITDEEPEDEEAEKALRE